MNDPQTAMTAAVYDALVSFNKTAHWPELRLAQIRQHLAEHIAADVTLRLTGVPAAVPVVSPPATGRARLRDRIAEALYANDHPGHLVPLNETGMGPAYRESADAVLAVLPEHADWDALVREADRLRREGKALHARAEEIDDQVAALQQQVAEPADRAAVFREAADAVAAFTGNDLDANAKMLRRMADEAQQPAEVPCCSDPTCTCNQVNAEGRCDCARWEPADEAQRQPDTETWDLPDARPGTTDHTRTQQTAAPVHAVPLPGSNGISACCGRPPCEFVGERVTRDPAAVTCPGKEG